MPNTGLPSRASTASLDFMHDEERNDENVSHWIFGGFDWNVGLLVLVGLWLHYRAVKPMAVSETKCEFHREGSMADSMATPSSTEAPLVRCRSLRSACRYRGQDRQGRTESVADEEFATTRSVVGRKATGLRQVRFLRLYPEVFADATYQ